MPAAKSKPVAAAAKKAAKPAASAKPAAKKKAAAPKATTKAARKAPAMKGGAGDDDDGILLGSPCDALQVIQEHGMSVSMQHAKIVYSKTDDDKMEVLVISPTLPSCKIQEIPFTWPEKVDGMDEPMAFKKEVHVSKDAFCVFVGNNEASLQSISETESKLQVTPGMRVWVGAPGALVMVEDTVTDEDTVVAKIQHENGDVFTVMSTFVKPKPAPVASNAAKTNSSATKPEPAVHNNVAAMANTGRIQVQQARPATPATPAMGGGGSWKLKGGSCTTCPR